MVVPLRARHPAPVSRVPLTTLFDDHALPPALVPLLHQMDWVMRTAGSDQGSLEVLRDSVWLFAEEAKRAGVSRPVMLYQLLACVQRNGGELTAEQRQHIVETCCDWAERRFAVAD